MKEHPIRPCMYWFLRGLSPSVKLVMYVLLLPILLPCSWLVLLGEAAGWLGERTAHLGHRVIDTILMRGALPTAIWICNRVDPSGPPDDTEDTP